LVTKEKLYEYISYNPKLYAQFGPDDISDFFRNEQVSMNQVRTEIDAYNVDLCPVKELGNGVKSFRNVAPNCIRTPAELCSSASLTLNGKAQSSLMIRPLALAIECILPNLVVSKKRLKSLERKASEEGSNPYVKWMIFVILSFLVGMKVSNTTIKLFNFANKNVLRDRARKVLKGAKRVLKFPFIIILAVSQKTFRKIYILITKKK
jgi:hypothetical protein